MSDDPGPSSEKPGWLRRNALLLAGLAVVVVGVATVILGSGLAPVAIGWFAYAPLAETVLIALMPLWQEPFVLGLLAFVGGLLVVAADLGFRAGLRRGRAS